MESAKTMGGRAWDLVKGFAIGAMCGCTLVGAIVIVLGVLSMLSLGGCASVTPPGPTFEQSSDAGVTKFVNQPPGVLGIREEGLNWAASGTASVKAVKVGSEGVMQLGSGPATRQVFWNPKSSAFVLSSETDFEVASASVYTPEGKLLYDVKGFKTSASEPTRAMAEPLAAWGKTLEALTDAELKAFQSLVEEQGKTVRAAVPKVADMLTGIAGIAGDVLKARAEAGGAK